MPQPQQRRRRRLNDEQVRALKVRAVRYTMPDPEMVGHYVRITPTGAKSFVAVARDPYGKQVWHTLGPAGRLTIAQAREQAREAIRRIEAGESATEPPPPPADSFQSVAENWLRRHVEAKGLRTRYEIERRLNKYVLPHWRDRPFTGIRRSDVARLLDFIEDKHGAR